MEYSFREAGQRVVNRVVDSSQKLADQCRRCRACDGPVELSEQICPQCGQSDPARIPLTTSVALICGAILVVIVAILIFW